MTDLVAGEAYTFAEQVVLGRILLHPEDAAVAFATVRLEDFEGRHALIANAIHQLRLARTPIGVLAVADQLERTSRLSLAGGQAYLHELTVAFGGFEYALGLMARSARLRRLQAVGLRITQGSTSEDADPRVIAAGGIEELSQVLAHVEGDEDVYAAPVDDFLAGEDEEHRWVIPGLLEATDRLVLTGREGLGKSVLMRQIAVCVASGVHPFTGARIPQQRVLIVDCENSRRQLRRALRTLVELGRRYGTDPSAFLNVECAPNGLDLTDAADEARIVRLAANHQPQLLITGPVYRLHTANPNDEETARTVTRVLDRCRDVAQSALILEAHAGHGSGGHHDERPVRPAGSSLWLRWPEFGYGLRTVKDSTSERDVKLVPWRGDRDERSWPTELMAGTPWPWQAVAGFRQPTLVEDPPTDNRYEQQGA
jgi:hypothetical protein